MRVKGMNEEQVHDIVAKVSAEMYDDNVIIRDSRDCSTSRTNHATFTLRVKDSRGPGARTSWSGRRMPSACWHVHLHVLRAMFHAYPAAVIRTAMATYTAETFEERAEATRWRNIGSMMQPAYMSELCDC
jgi:ribosomal protein L19E